MPVILNPFIVHVLSEHCSPVADLIEKAVPRSQRMGVHVKSAGWFSGIFRLMAPRIPTVHSNNSYQGLYIRRVSKTLDKLSPEVFQKFCRIFQCSRSFLGYFHHCQRGSDHKLCHVYDRNNSWSQDSVSQPYSMMSTTTSQRRSDVQFWQHYQGLDINFPARLIRVEKGLNELDMKITL